MTLARRMVCASACVAAWMCGCGSGALEWGTCDDCEPAAPEERGCIDGVSRRSPRTLAPGSVRVSEWMANPAGSDAELEWVEVLFEVDADLFGLQLGPSLEELHDAHQAEDCAPVDAGSRIVFGASPAAAPRVDAELPFSLANSGRRSLVVASNGVLLDRVDYEATVDGVAWQVDAAGTICEASADDDYADGNLGTPGAPNRTCPWVLGPEECLDEGVPRAKVRPVPGDVVLSEWMADPSAVDNRSGEWVEVRFTASVDANGLGLTDRSGAGSALQSDDCLHVQEGTHWVFARNENASENGGIEHVAGPLGMSLNNRDEEITLHVEEEWLDTAAYDDAEPGVAMQVDEDGRRCLAVDSYGLGDLGTPGQANPPCL